MKTISETTALLDPVVLAASPVPSLLDSGGTKAPGLASQLAVARAIQRSLLPTEFPRVPGFSLAAFCHSAGALGGDFYDVLSLDQDRLLLVIADVMGTGVPAALFASSLRMLVRSVAHRADSVSDILFGVNQQMYYELSSVDMFITAQLALVDTKRGVLQVASAGHCPVLLATHQGQTQLMAPEGLPLGIQPSSRFAEEVVALADCKCVFLYTDGLTEACDAQGTLFGQENLELWLRDQAHGALTADELRDAFLAELRRFQGNHPSRDDQTLIVLTREASKLVPEVSTSHGSVIEFSA